MIADWPLYWRLPPRHETTTENILDRFLDFIASRDLELYPAQEEAILALLEGQNVILNTPTGSGKSIVALALHFQSLARGRRSFYTCPIKALVAEKFRDLCADFGPDQVGMITGDGSVNAKAPIICCTAEILSNLSLREGELASVDDVVMDEFHYYSDPQRGVAWQVPLLTLPQSRFLLMSATLGEMDFFANALSQLNGQSTSIVRSTDRPVPLSFEYRETPLHETLTDLVGKGLAPIYLVNFSQREAADEAQNLLSLDFASKDEKKQINEAIGNTNFKSPYGKELQRLLRHGVGLHHAGLLPRYRSLVERLAQQGLLKVISGTDTLGVGVNVPIRTVLFTKLCKYDGEKTAILKVRDFQQISGRAGRRGYDSQGTVVAQAPAHVIENLRAKQKAAGDPKKLRKLVLKTPPPHGFVMWTQDTFEKLQKASPEPLTPRFQVTHGMLINVLGRPQKGCEAMRTLIHRSHGTQKPLLRKSAVELFRSLLDRKIVEFVRDASGEKQIRTNMQLQDDFSLNQTLALYLLDTLQVLDRKSAVYALDVLTLAESILESPELILRKQLDRLKTQKMGEMKQAGLEYEERMEELEKLEHPKPNRDFIYETFRIFADVHPWVGAENIRPKSIAREMYENFHSFDEYIREYDLQRIEGLLLRYLSEVYKVLEQTVPAEAKDDELRAISVYFGTMVRKVDSSLLDEWEKSRTGANRAGSEASPTEEAPTSLVEDHKTLMLHVRNELYHFLRALSHGDFETALALVDSPTWTSEMLQNRMSEYATDHTQLLSDLSARHPQHTRVTHQPNSWSIEQILVDPDNYNDWALTFSLDLEKTKLVGEPAIELIDLGPIGL